MDTVRDVDHVRIFHLTVSLVTGDMTSSLLHVEFTG